MPLSSTKGVEKMVVIVSFVVFYLCMALLSGYVAERIYHGSFGIGFFLGVFGIMIAFAKYANFVDKRLNYMCKSLEQVISNQEQIAAVL